MTQPIQEPSTARALQGMAYARDQIFRRPSPMGQSTLWWSMITDGFAECNTDVTYLLGGQYYGTNDLDETYYSYTQRSATYPGSGATPYFTVTVNETGIYLLDATGAWDWEPGNPGIGRFDLNPNMEAWAPFGFQTGENDSWLDEHVVDDTEFSAGGPYEPVFRVNGIASIEGGTEFFPTIRQESGFSTMVFAFNYFKIVRLENYAALADLRTGEVT